MFSDKQQPPPPTSYIPASSLRFGMRLTELWHDWFETMSQVTYQTHRACEFLVQNAAASNGQHGPFDLRSWRDPSQGPNGSIDMDKLKQCLQSMDSTQAARVMYAVQAMQVVEDMLKRQRSHANEPEGTAW
jgi:hypothetical protein